MMDKKPCMAEHGQFKGTEGMKADDAPKPRYYLGKVWKINRTLVAAPDLLAAIEVFVRENENVIIESITLLDREDALVKV